MSDTTSRIDAASTAFRFDSGDWVELETATSGAQRLTLRWPPPILDELHGVQQREGTRAALDRLHEHFESMLRAERIEGCRTLLSAADPSDYEPEVALGFLSALSVVSLRMRGAWTGYIERLEHDLSRRDGFPEKRVRRILAPYRR